MSFRALKAGMQRPLLVCPQHTDYKTCRLVAALGALQALYMVRKHSSRDGILAFSHLMSFGRSHHEWLLYGVDDDVALGLISFVFCKMVIWQFVIISHTLQ